LNGDLARDFFFVPVCGGAASATFPQRGVIPRGVKQRRHQLRLPGAAVADNANVAKVLGEKLFIKPPGSGDRNAVGVARSVQQNSGAGLRRASWN